MSDESQVCPKCNSLYGYPDGNLWICPECAHEWTLVSAEVAEVVVAVQNFWTQMVCNFNPVIP